MAGDVYSAPPYVGRGGWSWYTGSAAWMHRAAIESMFGVSQRGDELVVRPCLPSAWSQAELRLTRAGKTVRLLFVRATDAAPEVLAAAASARLLGVGETVRWSSLDGAVPLLVVMADAAARRASAAAAELAERGLRRLPAHVLQAFTRRSDPSRAGRLARVVSNISGPALLQGSQQEISMLKWAIIFAVIALIAGALGFTGVAAGAAGIAKILFVVFLVLFVAVLLFALLGAKAISNK